MKPASTTRLLTSLILFGSVASLATAGVEQETTTCIECHEIQDDELLEPVLRFKDDVHANAGLSCHDCHGGNPRSEDPDTAMGEEFGFRGTPNELEIPGFCGRCHSDASYMVRYNPALAIDQVEKYRSSVHGHLNAKGDRKVAQCASCHGAHGILPPDNPNSTIFDVNVPLTCAKCHSDPEYMQSYDIPTDQFTRYAKSVHGVALLVGRDTGAPACNDCHGNHGAIPPGVSSIGFVCGTCHVNNMDLFTQSPMREAFSNLHLPGCVTCHGNHDIARTSDEFVGTTPQAVCLNCHSEEKRPKGFAVARQIEEDLTRLAAVQTEADSVVRVAAAKGMDVLDAEYKLKDVRQARIEAKTLVHSFDPDRIKEKVDEGVTVAQEALAEGHKAIADHNFRWKGWGISTLILSLLVILFIFKIREVDRRARI